MRMHTVISMANLVFNIYIQTYVILFGSVFIFHFFAVTFSIVFIVEFQFFNSFTLFRLSSTQKQV